jgi:exopolysaccharide biosynthesis WecB/TagA/CpsF family protein
MKDISKFELLGINYAATDYETVADIIISQSLERKSFAVTALAVHGLIESYNNPSLRKLINSTDLILPDGQPIRWCLNYFYTTKLKDRVSGPFITWKVLEKGNDLKLKIFLYGSTQHTITKFSENINKHFPNIEIVGLHVDRFREASPEEDIIDINKINDSGAQLILVGRGCPRQEVWVANHKGKINGVMMAVGAAFDFHAKTLKQAPKWMQDNGLEWLFRLIQEPGRLWKRYLFTNSQFIYLILLKFLKLHK